MKAMRSMVVLKVAAAMAMTVVAGACVAREPAPGPGPAPEPGVGVAYYVPPGQEDPCPPDGCGGNSPVVNGVYFWQLHIGSLPGEPNERGVRILGVRRSDGTPMRLRLADGDRLLGVDPIYGTLLAQDTSLIDTRIRLDVNGAEYELRIDWATPSGRFWVGSGLEQIWQYQLRYRPISDEPGTRDEWQALCSEGDGDPAMVTAMVFGGDRYIPKTKEILLGADADGWMNIACAESAIYKMHRIGHTTAAQGRLGLNTTLEQRRAMLNAWTSNVCGTGEAFTQQGEPITLRDSLGWFNRAPYNSAPLSREAIWSERGAVCLDTHRLAEDDPEIYGKIMAACGGVMPPSCPPATSRWTGYGHVLTGNL